MSFDSVAYLIANIFWMYIIFRFYRCFFKTHCKNGTLLLSYLLLYLVNSSLHLFFHHPLLNMLSSFFGLCIITINYTATTLQKLLLTALIYSLSMICDLFVAIGFHTYYPGLKLDASNAFLAYFFLFILELVMERLVHFKKIHTLKTSHWAALVTVPVGSIFILFITIMKPHESKWASLSALFMLLLINFMIFYLYDSIQHVYIKEMRLSFLNAQLQAYKDQLDIMVHSQSQIHSIQHDLKHHLITIDALASQKKTEEIQTYIRKLKPFVQQSQSMLFTSNPVINSMLNYMLKDAKDSLHLDIQIQIPEDTSLDLFDISVVLGNLLDNALREALQSKEKELSLHVNCDKGLLHLFIKNSYCGPILRENGTFKTTQKQDEMHGIGLSNVKAIIEKHQGLLEFDYDNTFFSIYVLLYLSDI